MSSSERVESDSQDEVEEEKRDECGAPWLLSLTLLLTEGADDDVDDELLLSIAAKGVKMARPPRSLADRKGYV